MDNWAIRAGTAMKRYLRHSWIGLAAGLASSPALIATQSNIYIALALGCLIGVTFALGFRYSQHAYIDSLMTGAAFGIPLWAAVSIIVFPIISGQMPHWTAAGMRALFPQLTGWLLYGASTGLLVQALRDLAFKRPLPSAEVPAQQIGHKTHVVILGGGFAGMSTAAALEQFFGAEQSIDFTLVSETNALLFTPMLAEVAGSSLEPTHINSPLRTALHRTRVIRGKVSHIDLEGRRVTITLGDFTTQALTYDHLVLALGAVSNYLGLENVQRLAFDFKSLLDAIRIRNHVIDMFERADREPDEVTRQEILTFIVAGGGFAGVELAGSLNDFGRGMLADYPDLRPEHLRVILVHARDRILPELSEPLAAYALERMKERGVTFKLNARLTDARQGVVILKHMSGVSEAQTRQGAAVSNASSTARSHQEDEEIRAQTLVWTAGTTPNPFVKTLSVEHDKRGAIIVDSTMAVPNFRGVWALGDCAAVTDSRTGKPCPPTAQFALREARTLARNIYSSVHRKPLTPFHFDSLGALCVVGHQAACAELTLPFARRKSIRFSGLLAWMIWRSVYLAKLPGLERKARVVVDWTMELFFPRDIVQTIDLSETGSLPAQPVPIETRPRKSG